MATKKKPKRSKSNDSISKKKNLKIHKDIIAIALIGLSILVLVSFFTEKTGIIGNSLNSIFYLFFGTGSYVLPFLLIILSSLLLMDKNNILKFSTLIVLFLSILVILDSTNDISLSFSDRMSYIFNNLSTQINGGIVGALFGFLFYKLFGNVGTYIIIGFIDLVLLFHLIGKDNLISLREKLHNRSTKKNKTENKSINDEVTDKSENNVLQITDYTSSNKELEIISKKERTKKINDESQEYLINAQIDMKPKNSAHYTLPTINLLNDSVSKNESNDKKEIINNARIIEETMKNFGIEATVTHINIGPTITCYELTPAPGIKLSRIVSLSDNISLSLAMPDIRIEAPIPGKSAVGIEVPNKHKDMVTLKEMLSSKDFIESNSDLTFVLGKDITGKAIVSDIQKMPHLLIAGATGSGKSVCINTIIMSLLYKNSPDNVKMVLIDPKVVELNIYNGIPHLLIPVVTDPKKASHALNWAVAEMERRYKLFAQNNVRDIHSYNKKYKNSAEKLPKIIIIIDELADLMMVSANEIEDYIARLAQMARAAGMHLIVATQRPSVDVITGTIKANIPSRISFAVSSQIDSRTILDMSGAEKLLGQGDMLFFPSSISKPIRIQGAFVTNDEVEKVVGFLRENNQAAYDPDVIEKVTANLNQSEYDQDDELLREAIELVVSEQTASISLLQRRFKIGYARAARLIDSMEERGVIGGYEGSKPRKVLLTDEDLEE
ncbi:MAG TPA: DNA translocase FtsK 4TM domain-containing protein [Soehngenia sp.]|nr:DNA translocase FtsK 4TM domain-containing protein [Soehngenia sp.]